MNQTSLDLGRALRDDGMRKTLDVQPQGWIVSYRAFAIARIEQLSRGALFTAEDLRITALSRGLPQPGHPNAWSAAAAGVVRPMLKDGRIREAGAKLCERAEARARLIRVYAKCR